MTNEVMVTKQQDHAVLTLPKYSTSTNERMPNSDASASLRAGLANTHEGVSEHSLVQVEVSPVANDAHLEPSALSGNYAGAAHKAFADHHALVLRPDDLHILILQGIAKFFTQYPEDFRDDVVSFAGKKELVHEGDLYAGCPPSDWNELPEHFAKAIRANSKNPKFIDAILQSYSQSSALDQRIKSVTLMATFSPFFSYTERTRCYIPEFKMEGTEADWKKLWELPDQILQSLAATRNDTHEGGGTGRQYLRNWLQKLRDIVLAQCYAARQGNANLHFWESFYKYNRGSGGDTVTGYINYFYPFLTGSGYLRVNSFIQTDPLPGAVGANRLPTNMAEVDFNWEYGGKTYPMGIKAGFGPIAVSQQTGVTPLRFFSVFHKNSPPSGHKPVNLDKVFVKEQVIEETGELAPAAAAVLEKVETYIEKRKANKAEYYHNFQSIFSCFLQSSNSRSAKLNAARTLKDVLKGNYTKSADLESLSALRNGELGDYYQEYLNYKNEVIALADAALPL